MNHIMLDIETMGVSSNALVVSITAVQFDMSTGEIGSKFEIGLKAEEQLSNGAEEDAQTIQWWSEQSQEAQNMLNRLEKEPVISALELFNKWIKGNFKAPSKIKLWGNGATFDNVIVRNLYRRHYIDFVIPYYSDKDVRTLTYMCKINTRKFDFKGTKHNGLDDCLHQINYCVEGYKQFQASIKQGV